jgi:hypothetical protein
MVDDDERVVRDIELPGHVLRRGDEGPGADHQRGLAMLFERDAIVQTAQRATPSVTIGGDQQVDLAGQHAQLLCVGGLLAWGLLVTAATVH